MVIRYFGSKEGLFAAVADLDFKAASLAKVPKNRLGPALIRHVLSMWDDPEQGAALAAMMRASISNETAQTRIVGQFSQQLGALFAALGPAAVPAAPFIATQILGMTMARCIWRIPAVTALTSEVLIERIGKTVQRYLGLTRGP
jgi:AcrR family transcriptional regulator